jgi:ElaB/YqjD/DUF883 family membrane-anchored ribosome-binding protein
MFGQTRDSYARSANFREIDRRLRSMEQGLGRAGSLAVARAVGTTDHVRDIVAPVLASLVDRFQQLSTGVEARQFGEDAAKIGNDALRRLSKEVEHRPLVTLAVAVGVGLLVGLVIHRR